MYCPDCGNELDENGACSVCGRRFDAKGNPAKNTNNADKSDPANGAQQAQNAQQQYSQNAQQQYSQNGGYGYGYTNGYYGAPGGNYGYGYMQPQSDTANSYAIAGFVLSFIFPLVGLIVSILGYRKAKEMNGCGKGFAVAGIVISAVSLGSVLLIIVPIMIIYFAFIVEVGTSGYYAFALPALTAALAL